MEEKYLNAINLIPCISPKRFRKLLNYFPTADDIWHAPEIELKNAGLEQEILPEFTLKRSEINPEKEFEKLNKENIRLISIKDSEYPPPLKQIHDPPMVLYVRGGLDSQTDELSIGVVGTRRHSEYGKEVTDPIVADLVNYGFTIVSGMAKGIDTLSHKACLERGGRTIAVLGTGIDSESLYPSQNKYLAERISENGAVISEFPVGTLGLPQNFPQRNRIISGLSLGTLVIEAPEKSGALITARFALDQGREVFAVPGPIYSRTSRGPNNLIKMGAKAVTSVEDILEELNIPIKGGASGGTPAADSTEEETLLAVISEEGGPIHIDKIIKESKLDAATVSSFLTMMEIDGKIRNLGGGVYSIKR